METGPVLPPQVPAWPRQALRVLLWATVWARVAQGGTVQVPVEPHVFALP
jgi:hypothetical protein